MEKDRLLIIDDEFGPRESLRYLFKDQYDVVCVDSVDDGIQELKKKAPACIITDIKMPVKNGIQGLREIRALDPHVSIIMLTGFGSLRTAQEAIRHGASDYVKKPFDTEEMRASVQSHINKTRLLRAQQAAYENLHALNEQLQTELSSKEHLAQLGQASSEFLHDLRNPLTVISGYVGLMMSNIRDGSAFAAGALDTKSTCEYLEHMEKSVMRCQEMSQMWQNLSANGGRLRLVTCSLLDILKEVCDVLQGMAKDANARIELQAPDGDLQIAADNLQLYRAIQNLGSNALQALPKDGTGHLLIRLSAALNKARIEVLDNGCGIPRDNLEKVFHPYVSTKQKTEGMGIGLYITKKVIESHHGEISIRNRPEGGIAAVVELPLH